MNLLKAAEVALCTEPACWVEVIATQGSVPREAGTWMLVFASKLVGTIGGGHLELQAMQQAREILATAAAALERRYALGPSLGQCCGGAVHLRFERLNQGDLARLQHLARSCASGAAVMQVALFGAGHVGHALVRLLATLPCELLWVDSRDSIFPLQWLEDTPAAVVCEHSAPVQAAVADLAPHSQVLIMSFSHAEDFEIVAACLQRQRERADLPFIGLIGSATKWAVFRRRLEQRGFCAAEIDQVTCPIGVAGISGKEPEVIAVSVAAQLLQRRRNTGKQ